MNVLKIEWWYLSTFTWRPGNVTFILNSKTLFSPFALLGQERHGAQTASTNGLISPDISWISVTHWAVLLHTSSPMYFSDTAARISFCSGYVMRKLLFICSSLNALSYINSTKAYATSANRAVLDLIVLLGYNWVVVGGWVCSKKFSIDSKRD